MTLSIRRYRCIGPLVVCVAAILGAAPTWAAMPGATGFQERVYRDLTGFHRYTVFVPTGYTPDRKWPVILFLHGAGSRGTDNKLPMVGGIAPQVRARQASFPFIVVFPQCEDSGSRLMYGWQAGTADGQRALKILDEVEREFSVDRGHEILTGASMGAFGSWSLAAAAPERWSAVVIISGAGDPATAPRLKNIPIWVFHGQNDLAVSIADERRMVEAVREAGGRIFFTELPGVRHNVGHVIYADDAIYEWMLTPGSQPRPESFIRNAARIPNDAEMGRDLVQPFIPAAEIPQAIYLHLDPTALESLAYALPEMIPADAVAGSGADVRQSQQRFVFRFDVVLSNMRYRGTLEQMKISASRDGTMTIALGLRNLTLEIGSAEVNGPMFSASAGPTDIVIGHVRPAWLTLRVEPSVSDRHLHMELVDNRFEIADDNWYVTAPQVATRGVPIFRQRISNEISSKLVDGVYSRKREIESQIAQAAPALLQRIERQIDQKLSQTYHLGDWPMPAFQPRFRVWPDRLQVDDSGLSLFVGLTFARPGFDRRQRPVRYIKRPTARFEDLPRQAGLELGLSGGISEGLTAAITDTGTAIADAQDIPVPEFRALSDPRKLIDAIPDLARLGDQVIVRTRMQAVGPAFVDRAAQPSNDLARIRTGSASTAAGGQPMEREISFRLPALHITVDVKKSAQETDWTQCAEFNLQLSQQAEIRVLDSDFQTRGIQFVRTKKAEIGITGRFADSYAAVDRTLNSERIAELFRKGWDASEHLALFQNLKMTDKGVGSAKLRLAEIGWRTPFLIQRFVPAATRITNGSQYSLEYLARGPFSQWAGPYLLPPGQSHDYSTPYPVTILQIDPQGSGSSYADERRLPMGTHFVFDAGANRSDAAQTATNIPEVQAH